MDKQMDKDLIGHAHAFDSGIITREQLVKVLVPPFLKLIARVSHSLPESDSHLRAICDTLLCKWDKALSVILIGSSVPDGQGGSRLQMALRPQKRVELVKALVNAKYPEVRLRLSWHACTTHRASSELRITRILNTPESGQQLP